jgi:hypothetical protein
MSTRRHRMAHRSEVELSAQRESPPPLLEGDIVATGGRHRRQPIPSHAFPLQVPNHLGLSPTGPLSPAGSCFYCLVTEGHPLIIAVLMPGGLPRSINYEMCFNFVLIILDGRYDRILVLLQIFINPLYLPDSYISSSYFDTKVRILCSVRSWWLHKLHSLMCLEFGFTIK